MDLKNKILRLPIILFSAVVPLIVLGKNIVLSQEMYYAYSGVKSFTDFFSYYKMVMIIIAFAMALVLFLLFTKKEDYRELFKPLLNKLILGMMIIIILTSILSEYKFIVWFGFVDRYEGMFVCLAYLFFVLYINRFMKDLKDLKSILVAIIISSSIIALIGILQSYGYNFFNTSIGKSIIAFNLESGAEIRASKKISATSTLSNSNFVGSYMCMVIFLGGAFLSKIKARKGYATFTIYVIMILITLIKSGSAAGQLGFLIGGIFLILICIVKRLNKENYKFVITIMCSAIVLGGILIMPEVIKHGSVISNKKVENIDFKMYDNKVNFIKDNNDLEIAYKNNELIFVLNGKSILNKKIRVNDYNSGVKYIEYMDIDIDEAFVEKWFRISYKEKYNALMVKLKPRFVVALEITEDGFRLRDSIGRPLKYGKDILTFAPLEGKELWGSSRGYIWKRSIPFMRRYFLVGSGPDTFPAIFPQHDLVGKRKYMVRACIFIDKAHNMFIQMGINFGGLYLVLYLLFIGVYSKDSFKLYCRRQNRYDEFYLGAAVFSSVVAFNVAGLFNDSVVSVSPLYWTVVGMGLVINTYNKKMIDSGVEYEEL